MDRPAAVLMWQTPPGVRWHMWAGEVVAYHPGSGDTHLLAPVAGLVLQAVVSGVSSEEALCCHVAHRLDVDEGEDLAAAVAEAIATLARLGLLEPATP